MDPEATRPAAPVPLSETDIGAQGGSSDRTGGADSAETLSLERGELVGRYIVLDTVGAGAMGRVYRAFDPELDRQVALKVLLAAHVATDSARLRFQREAQAMARLSHPNVINVFDVGTVRGQVFLAMELVEGPDLADWLDERWSSGFPPTWREVIVVFRAAGRGLAAAHAAGLIHRDFKPSNVLVGKDGRVCVLDFGLARRTVEEEPAAEPGSTGHFRRSSDDNAALTRVGTVMGTPAYMSPEQHLGAETDARADQYAFCFSLYEALYGERPFEGRGATERYQAKTGPLPPPPEGTRVPMWLRRIVARGLSPRVDDRYPSMDALLAELGRDPAVRRRRSLAGLGAIALVAVGAVGYAQIRAERKQECFGALAKLAGIWDAATKQHIQATFVATGRDYAEGAWTATQSELNDYARKWSEMHTDACEATRIRGEQSEELLDRRMQCLDRRLQELDALTDLLARADDEVVRRSTSAATALTEVEVCADIEGLTRRVEPPTDPEVRMQVRALRADVAMAKQLGDAGKYADALEQARVAVERARALDYRPLVAEALLQLGDLYDREGDPEQAEQTLYEAAWAADASRHHHVEAQAWISLVRVVGYVRARPDEALRIGRQARASLEAAGDSDELTAALHNNLASAEFKRGAYDKALEHNTQALQVYEQLYGSEDRRVAKTLNDMGAALRSLGRYDEALISHEKAVEIEERVLGPNHPALIASLGRLGNVLYATGRLKAALAAHEHAYSIADDALGPEHPERANALSNLGSVHYRLGRLQQAEDNFRLALKLRERALGSDHPDVGASLNNLGLVCAAAGLHDEALDAYQRSIEIKRKHLGPRHPAVATSLNNLANVMLEVGRHREALENYQHSLEVFEETVGPSHKDAALSLMGIGQAHLALGDSRAATGPLERAIESLQGNKTSGARVAEARFALARALWDRPRERQRALTLAGQAREVYERAGKPAEARLRTVEEWLSDHAG